MAFFILIRYWSKFPPILTIPNVFDYKNRLKSDNSQTFREQTTIVPYLLIINKYFLL